MIRCICDCEFGFYGTTCNYYDCNAGLTDAIECKDIDCSIDAALCKWLLLSFSFNLILIYFFFYFEAFCPQTCLC